MNESNFSRTPSCFDFGMPFRLRDDIPRGSDTSGLNGTVGTGSGHRGTPRDGTELPMDYGTICAPRDIPTKAFDGVVCANSAIAVLTGTGFTHDGTKRDCLRGCIVMFYTRRAIFNIPYVTRNSNILYQVKITILSMEW